MKQDIVLLDTSILRAGFYRSNKSYFSDFENKILRSYQKAINHSKKLFQKDKSSTIPEISLEIFDLVTSVDHWYRKLEHKDKKNPRKFNATEQEDYEKKKELCRNLHDSVFDIYKLSRDKEIHVEDEMYPALTDLVRFISEELKLEKKTSGDTRIEKNKDLEADRKLIAQAYFQAITNKKTSFIITNDRDLPRLNLFTKKILTAGHYLKNPLFTYFLREKPVLVYLSREHCLGRTLSQKDLKVGNIKDADVRQVYDNKMLHERILDLFSDKTYKKQKFA